MCSYRMARRVAPSNQTELLLLGLFEQHFGVDSENFGVDASLLDLGPSVDLMAFKKKSKGCSKSIESPVIIILTNPSARVMTEALGNISAPQAYNPVVTLQPQGSNTPLWQVLVFLNLSRYVTIATSSRSNPKVLTLLVDISFGAMLTIEISKIPESPNEAPQSSIV